MMANFQEQLALKQLNSKILILMILIKKLQGRKAIFVITINNFIYQYEFY